MTNIYSVLVIKSRDITLPTKVCIVKAGFVPIVTYKYESWAIKKAECWRIDAFELWCWRRLLRVPWIARRSNQSILREINPEYSLERLVMKLQYFCHWMWRADSLEKTLMLGKIESKRRRGQLKMSWLESITDTTDMNFSKLWKILEDREAWCPTVHGIAKRWTKFSDWTTNLKGRGQSCEAESLTYGMGSVAILQVDSVRIKINGTNSVFTKYLQLKKKADGSTFLNISILKECSFPILSVSVTLTNIMAIPFPLSTSFYSLPWKKTKLSHSHLYSLLFPPPPSLLFIIWSSITSLDSTVLCFALPVI